MTWRKSLSHLKNAQFFFQNLQRAFRKTTPNLLIGILLAAMINLLIPHSWYESFFSGHQVHGVFLATLLSVPLYYCGGGSIPIVREWLDSGMSTGAALAFLLAGPSTKINNLAALKIIVSAGSLAYFTAFNLICAILAGLLINLVV